MIGEFGGYVFLSKIGACIITAFGTAHLDAPRIAWSGNPQRSKVQLMLKSL